MSVTTLSNKDVTSERQIREMALLSRKLEETNKKAFKLLKDLMQKGNTNGTPK